MSSIKLKVNNRTTSVDNIFIDKYMAKPDSAVFSLIYIYALRCAGANENIDNKGIAQKFQILESDVVKAWRYWEKEGLLALHKDGEYEIEFLDIRIQDTEVSAAKEIYIKTDNTIRLDSKPQYNPSDIVKVSDKNPEVNELLGMAQKILNKTLSSNDLSTLFGIYDWLGLPLEVIAVLLTYCSRNKKSMRYIEKTAIDWAEKGINTSELAEDHLNMFYSEYKEILKCFGIRGRMANDEEQVFMNTWLKKYKMPLEIIKIACNRTLKNTGQVNFPYAEGIIQSWHNNKVKTIDDIEKIEEEFNKKNEQRKEAKNSNKVVSNKPNKFINYEQRSYNPEDLRNIEKMLLDKEAKK